MGSEIPANLSVTKVYLTDKPYEVQVAVLRWVKNLVGNLVDAAVQRTRDEARGGDWNEDLVVVKAEESKGDDSGAGSNTGSTAGRSFDTNSCDEVHTCMNHISNGIKRRKRLRTPSLLHDGYKAGAVVECFFSVS